MSEIMGTAFLVHGQWYLRYLHGGGAMVPIEASKDVIANLEDAEMCAITGSLGKDHLGCPQRVHATAAKVLGK